MNEIGSITNEELIVCPYCSSPMNVLRTPKAHALYCSECPRGTAFLANFLLDGPAKMKLTPQAVTVGGASADSQPICSIEIVGNRRKRRSRK